jgi:iron complex transport system substrate-binding protein
MRFASRLTIIFAALAAVLIMLLSAPVYAQDGTFPRTVTDGAGNAVTINARPTRIVSVTLATDEILLSLVDPSRLVGVTANSQDPAQSNVAEAAKAIPNKVKADPETLIALKPDLVFVGSFTDAGVIKQLKDAGLTVFLIGNFNSIKDIENNVTLLGQVVGEEKQAAGIVDAMEAKLKTVADAVKGVEKPLTVMYYSPDGYSDGPGTTVDEVLTRAGGVNAVTAGGIKDPFPQLNDEFVVKQDPDVILLAGFNSYSPGFVEKFNGNPNFQTLKALKNKHVYVANDAHITSISQYIVEGVSDVAALLYPDRYKPTPAATANATVAATAAR